MTSPGPDRQRRLAGGPPEACPDGARHGCVSAGRGVDRPGGRWSGRRHPQRRVGGHAIYSLLRFLTFRLDVPLARIALASGVSLALTSTWGIFCYWWGTIKLAIVGNDHR